MLPAAYQQPAAALLVAGGLLACFLGYRLFKVVLALVGFILGALAASWVFGVSDTAPTIIAALVGGLAGAGLLFAAYFIGVPLLGAGIGVIAANVIWTRVQGDPHPFVVVLFSVAGALVATWLQRYVIILATAFVGSWAIIVGVLAMRGNTEPLKAAAQGDVWVVYPMNPAPGQNWVPWAWLAVGMGGTLIQMYVTGGERGRVKINKKKSKE
jgi:hypothetical protein